MIDLTKIMQDTMVELEQEKFVEQAIKQKMEKTIQSIVDDVFGSWSKFGKNAKEQVEGQVEISLQDMTLPSYNHVIMNTIKSHLEQVVQDQGVKKITEQLDAILGTSPGEVKLSQLIESIVHESEKVDQLDFEDVHTISVHVDQKFKYSTRIYIDPEDDDIAWYNCKYKITLDEHGAVMHVEIDDTEFTNDRILGGLYGVELELFKMWTQRTKLILDDYEVEFTNPEYDD